MMTFLPFDRVLDFDDTGAIGSFEIPGELVGAGLVVAEDPVDAIDHHMERVVVAEDVVFHSRHDIWFRINLHHVLAKESGSKALLTLSRGAAIMVSVMRYQYLRSLYEQCMEEVNHVPPERRRALLEIAEIFSRLASECAPDRRAPGSDPRSPEFKRMQQSRKNAGQSSKAGKDQAKKKPSLMR